MAGCESCWQEAQRRQDAGDLRPVAEIYADLVTQEYIDLNGLPSPPPWHLPPWHLDEEVSNGEA